VEEENDLQNKKEGEKVEEEESGKEDEDGGDTNSSENKPLDAEYGMCCG
jgi:hypothetical protein